jgi:hypothetical protein
MQCGRGEGGKGAPLYSRAKRRGVRDARSGRETQRGSAPQMTAENDPPGVNPLKLDCLAASLHKLLNSSLCWDRCFDTPVGYGASLLLSVHKITLFGKWPALLGNR